MEIQDISKFLPIFKEEVAERLHKIVEALLSLERMGYNREVLLDLQREAHTIKGLSKMMGFDKTCEISHDLEESFILVLDGKEEPNTEVINNLLKRVDLLKASLEGVDSSHIQNTKIHTLQHEMLLRIPFAKLERISILSLELNQAKLQIEKNLEGLKQINLFLEGLEEKQLTSLDLEKIRGKTRLALNGFSESIDELGVLLDSIHKDIQMMRLVSLKEVFEDFPRMIREFSIEENKKIKFCLTIGLESIDRSIAKEVKSCVLHIIRNSVRHGIEEPEERIRLGKPEEGIIKVTCGTKADSVFIEIEDDGRGISPSKVKEIAVRKGLRDESQIQQMSEQEIIRLVMLPGFSSSATLDSLSGRGIGLDAVRSEIERIGGSIEIITQEGRFTRVAILIPLTLGLILCLLIQENGQTFAIPTSFIERCLNPSTQDIIREGDGLHLDRDILPVVKLNALLRLSQREIGEGSKTGVLLRYAGRRLCLLFDKIIEERKLVLKPLGNFLGKLQFFLGAGVLAVGSIALILDIPEIFEPFLLKSLRRG